MWIRRGTHFYVRVFTVCALAVRELVWYSTFAACVVYVSAYVHWKGSRVSDRCEMTFLHVSVFL